MLYFPSTQEAQFRHFFLRSALPANINEALPHLEFSVEGRQGIDLGTANVMPPAAGFWCYNPSLLKTPNRLAKASYIEHGV